MKLLLDKTPVPKRVDETAHTASTIRFHRKRRLIARLEELADEPVKQSAPLVDCLVSYIDDAYIKHLVGKVNY